MIDFCECIISQKEAEGQVRYWAAARPTRELLKILFLSRDNDLDVNLIIKLAIIQCCYFIKI